MNFGQLQHRLVHLLQSKVRNGQLTERSLARSIGVSQPHIHNVLKGVRILSPEVADSILQHLNLSILDLVEKTEFESYRHIPGSPLTFLKVLEGRVGPGYPWPSEVSSVRRFRVDGLLVRTMLSPVVVRTAQDEAMERSFTEGDFALLDQSDVARSDIRPEGLYLLRQNGEGLIRRARTVARSLYIVTDENLDRPAAWERISLSAHDIRHVIRARVTFVVPHTEWDN